MRALALMALVVGLVACGGPDESDDRWIVVDCHSKESESEQLARQGKPEQERQCVHLIQPVDQKADR